MINFLKAEIYGIKNIILNEINILEYKSIVWINRDDIYILKKLITNFIYKTN